MDQQQKDLARLTVMIRTINREYIPRMLKMQERVERGEKLSDHELGDLQRVYDQTMQNTGVVDRNPEFADVSARYATLFNNIISKAAENEDP